MHMQTFEALPSSEQIVRWLEYNFPYCKKEFPRKLYKNICAGIENVSGGEFLEKIQIDYQPC